MLAHTMKIMCCGIQLSTVSF